MDYQIEILSQDAIEENLTLEATPTKDQEVDADGSSLDTDGFAIYSASGFAIYSASGFAIYSASGFAIY